MTRARLDAEELDLIEEAMIDLGKEYTKTHNRYRDEGSLGNIAKISTAIGKINAIRKVSKIDAIDISSAHGG